MVTFLLYMTVYLAILGQAVLDVIHLTSALIVSLRYYSKIPPALKLHLFCHWIVVILAGIYLIFVLNAATSNDFYFMTAMYAVPMAAACYFVYVANAIYKFYNPTKTIVL